MKNLVVLFFVVVITVLQITAIWSDCVAQTSELSSDVAEIESVVMEIIQIFR